MQDYIRAIKRKVALQGAEALDLPRADGCTVEDVGHGAESRVGKSPLFRSLPLKMFRING